MGSVELIETVSITVSITPTPQLSRGERQSQPSRPLASARARRRRPALTKALVFAAVPEGYRVFEAPEARRTNPWASPAGSRSRDLATRSTMSVRRGHLPPGAPPPEQAMRFPGRAWLWADTCEVHAEVWDVGLGKTG